MNVFYIIDCKQLSLRLIHASKGRRRDLDSGKMVARLDASAGT
jgi:hypothetical protein